MFTPTRFLSLVLPGFLAFLGSAHARSVDLVEPHGDTRTLTEAEVCEKQLTDLRKSELYDRLMQVRNNEALIESTLTRLQELGEIKTERDYEVAKAELTIGPDVLEDVLLPEAVYQVFKARYESRDGVRRALSAFRSAEPADQAILIGEVIERITQFITDVGVDNLSSVPEAAAFLGMNPTQLGRFRDKWMYYDSDDQFAKILQTGVLYAMVALGPGFTDRVLARSGPIRWVRRSLALRNIPARPVALNPKMDLRQVQIEDLEYYDTGDLMAYLEQSSTAARRFFVTNRMSYLTRDQLEKVYDRRAAYRLKKTLVSTLEAERAWRQALRPKWERLSEVDRDRTELRSRISRLEDNHVYDTRQVFENLDAMFAEPNANVVAEQANTLLKEQVQRCDEVKLARLIGKIVDSGGSRMRSSPELALRFLDAAVGYANAFNLTDDQLRAVQLDLTKLANALPLLSQRRGRALVQNLVSSRPKFANLKLPELKAQLERTEADRDAASRELDQVYRRF